MNSLIDLKSYPVRTVLPILLRDQTTQQNIIWATDTYEAYGEKYGAKCNMTLDLILNGPSIQPRIAKAVTDQADRTKKHAEVFTPSWICNRMVNHCDEVWFGRKDVFNTCEDKTWTPTDPPITFPKRKRWQNYVDSRRLEITCGEAPYLASRYDASTGEMIPFKNRIGILDRKLRVVNENAADEAEWWKYTYRAFESVYGYEYQGDNLLIARINLLLTFAEMVWEKWQREAEENELRKAANIISWNIWQMDGLKGTVPFGSLQEAYTQLSFLDMLGLESSTNENTRPACRIYDWRGQGKLTYNDRKTRKGREMKFDFVIGNPPYQDETTGDQKTFAAPVYHLFLNEAYKVSDHVEMIHPARFLFNAGSTPKKWNEMMLKDKHFKILFYEPDSHKVFNNTEIKAGVVISYHDNTQEFEAIENFTTHPELNTILKKVKKANEQSLSECILSRTSYRLTDKMHHDHPEALGCLSKGHPYDMATNIFDRLPFIFFDKIPQDGNSYIQILGRENNTRIYKYIRSDYVNKVKNLYKYKILLAKANGSGMFGECLAPPIIAGPNIGSTESFVGIGLLNTAEEAEALLKYLKTKFSRALLGVLKTTQDITPEKYKFVPLQDFTHSSDIDWSVSVAEIDRQLYKKYNLSEEEIAFIETNVKEMA